MLDSYWEPIFLATIALKRGTSLSKLRLMSSPRSVSIVQRENTVIFVLSFS